jgi:hypothetical protein
MMCVDITYFTQLSKNSHLEYFRKSPGDSKTNFDKSTSTRRMPSSWMRHHVALVRTDVSEEYIASIIRVERTSELVIYSVLQWLVTANVVPSSLILYNLIMVATGCSRTSVLTRATGLHISEYYIPPGHGRETSNIT